MIDASLAATTPIRDTESFEALVHLAGRRTLPIPAEILAEHAMGLPGP